MHDFIETTGYPLPVTPQFIEHLANAVDGQHLDTTNPFITLSFTDPDYAKKPGGFHPTEVVLKKHDMKWRIVTIMDYCNVSQCRYPKWAPDLEFNFELKQYHNIGQEFDLPKAQEIYQLWEKNFIYFWQDCQPYQVAVY